jgi:transposase
MMWLYSSGHTETRTPGICRGVFDESAHSPKVSRCIYGTAVKLAVESDQPMAQTARDRGINDKTFHTWLGKYHRVERQAQQVNDAHLYEELQRLRKENSRLKEERDLLKKAAAYFAQQLPGTTHGYSSTPSVRGVAGVSSSRSRAVAPRRGAAVHPVLRPQLISRYRTKSHVLVRRAVAPTARAASSIGWRRQAYRAAAVSGAS